MAHSGGTWKPGQSGNPNGRPKEGQSWAVLFKEVGNLTGKQAAKRCRALAGVLAEAGDKATLKEVVVLRVYLALMNDPSSGLLKAVMERAEGVLPQPIELSWREQAEQEGIDPDAASAIFEQLVQHHAESVAAREDERGGMGRSET